jgi:hypothetical protein
MLHGTRNVTRQDGRRQWASASGGPTSRSGSQSARWRHAESHHGQRDPQAARHADSADPSAGRSVTDRRGTAFAAGGRGSTKPPRKASGGTGDRQADTNEFYRLLDELARRVGGKRYLRDCTGHSGWRRQGFYFFYEDGETRADGGPWVVRVGTHALTAKGKATLWGRLRQHRGRLAGFATQADATTAHPCSGATWARAHPAQQRIRRPAHLLARP